MYDEVISNQTISVAKYNVFGDRISDQKVLVAKYVSSFHY